MAEEQDDSQVLETGESTDTAAVETPEEEQVTLSKAEADELRRKADERDELEKKNKQLFERAKKKDAASPQDGLTNKDVLYLAKTDIHADDLDEVVEMARLKKVDVKQAHEFMAPILAKRAEERTTAQATHTRPSARGSSQESPEDFLMKAERGETVESNEGMQAIFQARAARRLPTKRK